MLNLLYASQSCNKALHLVKGEYVFDILSTWEVPNSRSVNFLIGILGRMLSGEVYQDAVTMPGIIDQERLTRGVTKMFQGLRAKLCDRVC